MCPDSGSRYHNSGEQYVKLRLSSGGNSMSGGRAIELHAFGDFGLCAERDRTAVESAQDDKAPVTPGTRLPLLWGPQTLMPVTRHQHLLVFVSPLLVQHLNLIIEPTKGRGQNTGGSLPTFTMAWRQYMRRAVQAVQCKGGKRRRQTDGTSTYEGAPNHFCIYLD